MHELRFETVTDDERTEQGEFDGEVLETGPLSRPNFRLEDDDSVTLLSAKTDVEIPHFGSNPELEEVA